MGDTVHVAFAKMQGDLACRLLQGQTLRVVLGKNFAERCLELYRGAKTAEAVIGSKRLSMATNWSLRIRQASKAL